MFKSGPAPRPGNGPQGLLRPGVPPVKIQYFEDTDTLYIEFRAVDVAETRDLDENTTLDLDADGSLLAITVEHASTRTDVRRLTVEGIAA